MRSILLVMIVFALCCFTNAQDISSCDKDYLWLVKTLNGCKYPIKQQNVNREAFVSVEYKVNNKGYVISPRIVHCSDRKFKKATLEAFLKVKHVQTDLKTGMDTLNFQYKIQGSSTPFFPQTDIRVIGYGTCDEPVLMRYQK